MGGPLQTGQVSSKSVRWLVPPLPGPFVDALLKKQLQHLAKKMNPTTHRSLQKEWFALKKKYKKQVKLMHKKYKNDLINEINALSSEHSQDVWRQINKLRKESTVEEETLISPEAWIQHFRQYNNETNVNTSFANDSDETENL